MAPSVVVLLPICAELESDDPADHVFQIILKNAIARKIDENYLGIAFKAGMSADKIVVGSEILSENWKNLASAKHRTMQSKLLGFWAIKNYPLMGKKFFGDGWKVPQRKSVEVNSKKIDCNEIDQFIFRKMKLTLVELTVSESTLEKLKHFVRAPPIIVKYNPVMISQKAKMFDIHRDYLDTCWNALKNGQFSINMPSPPLCTSECRVALDRIMEQPIDLSKNAMSIPTKISDVGESGNLSAKRARLNSDLHGVLSNGAFLIPFTIMLVLEGIPLFLIELGMGQKMRLGSLGVWNTIHPWLGGIGISSCIVTLFVVLYYNVIITWCLFYFVNSFRFELPWASCPKYPNSTVPSECKSPTSYFWYRTTLNIAPSIDEPGELNWWIVLCLFIAWTIVFFIVMKGIQSSGKVVYFTSLFPYIVLTIFFVRGITLEGAGAGLMHMYKPQYDKLLDAQVWLDAATQVFYSFGLAFGSLIAFGSYNTPKNNCVRDVLLVSVCNAFTAIYASVVIFAILGFKATNDLEDCIERNVKIMYNHTLLNASSVPRPVYEEAYAAGLKDPGNETLTKWGISSDCTLQKQLGSAAEGTGLAFIVFTQAIVQLPGAPFWSILFFTMLLSLGIGSQIGLMEGMLCTLFDIDIMKRLRKQYVTAGVCVFCFFVGLIFCTGAGEYWLKLFDSFAGTIGLVVIALMESIAVIYVYGHERFTEDIYQMTGYRPGAYWQYTWRFIGPIIMTFILLASLIKMIISNPEYSAWNAEEAQTKSVQYPNWVMGIAVAMMTAGVLPMPIVFCLRRFQILKVDLDIHQGSIRRNETTASTKVMMDDDDLYSPDMPPENSLSATRFTIGDFDDDDDDDFSGPAIGGRVGVRSDSDDEDEPPTLGNMRSQFRSSLTAPNKRPFSMEVIDF